MTGLRRGWRDLVGGADAADLVVCLEQHLFDWKGKSKRDVGWCYFSVTGPDLVEGIAFVVGSPRAGDLAVRSIAFGRP